MMIPWIVFSMYIGLYFINPLAPNFFLNFSTPCIYEGHLESKERFAIKKYLLIIGKKKNMQI